MSKPLTLHSKYKNTGILFEILIRRITSDTLSNNKSPAVEILKKYFTKSELSKEYKLFDATFKNTNISESKANNVISTVLDLSKKLNRTQLRKEKYNLIKEIKNHYDLDEFFKTKISNYKPLASLYSLMELYNTQDLFNPSLIVENKTTLLEYLTENKNKRNVKNDLIEEFKKYDKDLRILTYKILLEKFNDKYSGLNNLQKEVLKEFINSVDSSIRLKEYYNGKIQEFKIEIKNKVNKIDDKSTKIKLMEISKLLKEIDKSKIINENNLIDLLQYCELIEELKTIK